MIGTLLTAASAIYGGIQSAQANKSARNRLRQMDEQNKAWYDRNYNEDYTRRADAQRILQMTEERIKQRNRQAAGTAAVMGGSNEMVAAQQAANGEAMANVMGQVAAAGAERKAQVDNQYMQTQQGIAAQMGDMDQKRADNIAKATAGVAQAAGELEGWYNGKKEK